MLALAADVFAGPHLCSCSCPCPASCHHSSSPSSRRKVQESVAGESAIADDGAIALLVQIGLTRHSSTRRFLIRVYWMLVALIAPEYLLYLAINERIDAHNLEKRAAKDLQCQPIPKPGMLTRGFNHILRRAKPDGVSPQKHARNNSSYSLNMAGVRSPCGAENSPAEAPLRSRPCVLCDDGRFQIGGVLQQQSSHRWAVP
jgi:hypothetical protein